MPLYAAILISTVLVLFSVNLSASQYYNMLNRIPQYIPAALNPLVSIVLIKPYRRALLGVAARLFKCIYKDNIVKAPAVFVVNAPTVPTTL